MKFDGKRFLFTVLLLFVFIFSSVSFADPPKSSGKSKFYDFSEQVIDGEIRKPTTLYTDARKRVKFERLLRLKKSFLPRLFDTAKEKIFK